MRRLHVVVVLGLAGAIVASAEPFVPGCTLPCDAIKQERPIDATCGPAGSASGAKHQAQNRAKNNLCAAGTPVALSRNDFLALHAAVVAQGISFGHHSKLPDDRSVLRDLHTTATGTVVGEGSGVRHVALVHKDTRPAHGTESVNCTETAAENNDIHVDLVQDASESPCDSITAEIIPHFRPAAWTVGNLKGLGRPVRVTGHLFFDASHVPCENGVRKPGHPARPSIWEIHPVYAIDVCRNASVETCRAAAEDETRWVPFHEWLQQPQPE